MPASNVKVGHLDGKSAIFTTLCDKMTEALNSLVTVLRLDQISKATLLPDAIVVATVELETPVFKTATEIELARLKVLIQRTSTIF